MFKLVKKYLVNLNGIARKNTLLEANQMIDKMGKDEISSSSSCSSKEDKRKRKRALKIISILASSNKQ